MKNYYDILGVGKTASQKDIKKAYRELAKQHHPDVNGKKSDSANKFMEIAEAYRTLSDPVAREKYDAQLNRINEDQTDRQSKNNNKTAYTESQEQNKYQQFDINNIEKSFERFFGFHPKSTEIKSNNNRKARNPIDMTDAFEKYFQTGRKK